MEKNQTDKAIEILNKYQFIFDKGTEYCSLLDALENLKTYEATGLNAEDFNDLKVCLEDEGGVEGTISDLIELMHYRNLEEQGLLIKLPCKIGDMVYLLSSPINVTNFEDECGEEDILIFECEVNSITKYLNGEIQIRLCWNDKFVGYYLTPKHFGKIIFLTKEKAEKELERLKGAEVDG